MGNRRTFDEYKIFSDLEELYSNHQYLASKEGGLERYFSPFVKSVDAIVINGTFILPTGQVPPQYDSRFGFHGENSDYTTPAFILLVTETYPELQQRLDSLLTPENRAVLSYSLCDIVVKQIEKGNLSDEQKSLLRNRLQLDNEKTRDAIDEFEKSTISRRLWFMAYKKNEIRRMNELLG